MTINVEWPEFSPDIAIDVVVTNGVMTLAATSRLANYTDFDLSAPNIRGSVVKNGTRVGAVTISATGVLSIADTNVAQGDAIVLEFKVLGRVSLPWVTRATLLRLVFLTIPTGNSTTTFNGTTNRMPVPSFDLAFGWNASANLQAAMKVSNADGASQSLTLYTRLFGTCPNQESSTSINLSSTSVQTETSTFAKGAMNKDCEIEWWLQSGTGSTRQEERVRIAWSEREDVPSYPTTFPTSGTHLKQAKQGNAIKLYRP